MRECPLCDARFYDTFGLACHLAGEHGWKRGKGRRRYACACGLRYLTLETLHRHLAFMPDLRGHLLEASLGAISRVGGG